MPIAETPFRALFLLRNKLEDIQVVPLGATRANGGAAQGGVLQGREELLTFVREVGFDSIVESYQVSNLPRPSFLCTFHLAPSPDAVVRILEQRLVAEPRLASKVLELADGKAPEQLALSPQEAFQLGATTLGTCEGLERLERWFVRDAGSGNGRS